MWTLIRVNTAEISERTRRLSDVDITTKITIKNVHSSENVMPSTNWNLFSSFFHAFRHDKAQSQKVIQLLQYFRVHHYCRRQSYHRPRHCCYLQTEVANCLIIHTLSIFNLTVRLYSFPLLFLDWKSQRTSTVLCITMQGWNSRRYSGPT